MYQKPSIFSPNIQTKIREKNKKKSSVDDYFTEVYGHPQTDLVTVK
jgi:hypothetical protein